MKPSTRSHCYPTPLMVVILLVYLGFAFNISPAQTNAAQASRNAMSAASSLSRASATATSSSASRASASAAEFAATTRSRAEWEATRSQQKEMQRENRYLDHLGEDIAKREKEVKWLKKAVGLDKLEVTLIRYYQDETGTSGYVFVDDKPIGYTIEPPPQNNEFNINSIPPGSYSGHLRFNAKTKGERGSPGLEIELDNGILLEIKKYTNDEAATELETAIRGSEIQDVSEVKSGSQSDSQPHPSKGIQFAEGKTNNNTGLLLMALESWIGKDWQYYWPYGETDMDKIDFFESRGTVTFAQFGKYKHPKACGTTNCVNLPLEILFIFAGGVDGSINGTRVTDPLFNGFGDAFLWKEGLPKDAWVEALFNRKMGARIPDLQTLRVGDYVQTGHHRAMVLKLVKNAQGAITGVVVLDANIAGEDWKTRSAIHYDRTISIDNIQNAARLYDLIPQPNKEGLDVLDVTSNRSWSSGLSSVLPESKGILVLNVTPNSMADTLGILPGDIITEWNGRSVDSVELTQLIFQTTPGTKVQIKVWRNYKEQQFKATMGSTEAQRASASPAKEVRLTVVDQTSSSNNGQETKRNIFNQDLHLLDENQDHLRDQMMHRDHVLMIEQQLQETYRVNLRAQNQLNEQMNRSRRELQQPKMRDLQQMSQYFQQRHLDNLQSNATLLRNLSEVGVSQTRLSSPPPPPPPSPKPSSTITIPYIVLAGKTYVPPQPLKSTLP